jgi:hypothetical protein
LDLSDIVKSSALSVLPAIPLLLLGAYAGIRPELPEPQTTKQKIKNVALDLPYFALQATVILGVLAYVTLGVYPELGAPLLVLLIGTTAGKILLIPILREIKAEYGLSIWVFLIVMLIFTIQGAMEGFTIRSGKREKYPELSTTEGVSDQLGKQFVVRRFSNGILGVQSRHLVDRI